MKRKTTTSHKLPDFQALFESAPDLYLVLSPDLTILGASDAYLAATMTEREAILGKALFDVFPDSPNDPNATGVANLRSSLARVISTGEPDMMAVQKYDIRNPKQKKSGFEERHWSPMNSPVFDAKGKLAYILHRVEDVTAFMRQEKDSPLSDIGSINVITARRIMQQEMEKAHHFLQDMLNHIPDPIFMKDKEHRWIGGNEAFWKLMDGPPEKFIGKSDYEFFPKEEADVFWEKDNEVLNSGKALVYEEFFTDSTGRRHVFSTKKIAFPNEQGEKYLVGVIRDITDIKLAEEEREKLIDELTESNTQLERFAYICSHDLQEPIRMIASFSDRLAKHLGEPMDDKAKRYIDYIRNGASHARNLINDVLTYARIGNDLEPPAFVEVEMVLKGVLEDLAISIKETGANITHDALPRVPARRTHIRQLFLNLLTNALKFSRGEAPRVHIGVKQVADYYEFSVQDNGIGIEPEYLHKLFNIFQRLHSRDEYPGTGVGLAICKKIVQQYDGEVWVESKPGEGTCFYFSLPATMDKQEKAA